MVMASSKVSMEELVGALDHEFEDLRQEAAERAQEAARGAALLGTAGALGLVSLGTLASLPLLALRRVMPARQIALIVAGGTAASAIALGRMGLTRLAAVAPKAVEQVGEEAVEEVASAAG
jgi:hypothetical protein